jgi:hypothetical protein
MPVRRLYPAILLLMLVFPWQRGIYWAGGLAVPAYWKVETRNYRVLTDSDYEIRVAPALADSPAAAQVMAAMESFEKLGEYFGASLPPPLVIVMEAEVLNNYVGGGYSLNSAGVYQNGVILLGIRAGTGDLKGTLIHELGHHYVHGLTRGNCPTWLSEGLAQMLEERLSDSLWFDGKEHNDYYKYSISELSGDFYGLPDQVSAYNQALELVRVLETSAGGQAISAILGDLGRGMTLPQALLRHAGMGLEALSESFPGRE